MAFGTAKLLQRHDASSQPTGVRRARDAKPARTHHLAGHRSSGARHLAMFRWDADGTLQAMSGPTLIIAGDTDIVTLKAASKVIAVRRQTAAS